MLTRPIKKYAINLAPPSNEKDTSIAYGVWVSNSRPTGEAKKDRQRRIAPHPATPLLHAAGRRDEERGGDRRCQFATVHC